MFKSLAFLFFFFFFLQGLRAQYTNVDSLVFLPGYEKPLSISEVVSLMENLPVENLSAGQEFFYGQPIPMGILLKHFSMPCAGKVISRYGWRSGRMHTGTDLKMAKGDTIYATFGGTVTRARYLSGYGNMVVIDHGNNLETSYAHLTAFLVKPEDKVHKQQPIGLAGSTGRTTTSHLHFEIKEGGRHFNPELVFDFENNVVKEEVFSIRHLADLQSSKNREGSVSDKSIPQSYVVAAGDSLWKISRRYKTSVQALCQLNNLNQNSVLNVGMVLKLF